MVKIVSILLLSYIGWKVAGDFFTLSALISFSIDLYIGLQNTKDNITKDKTAIRQREH